MSAIDHQNHFLYHKDIEGFDTLEELALNLRWSWSHSTDEVWRQLDPYLWDLTHNPWAVLQTVSKDKLKLLLSDPSFCKLIQDLVKINQDEANCSGWFQEAHPKCPLKCIAYFSMEYMLTEALPIYSGGLGNVAGDQLKSSSDLAVPVIAIGLLYQQGYFRQIIDKNGMQQALYPFNDPGQLPITPLRKPNGEWLRIEVVLPGYSLWFRTWQVQVGRSKLYLLDSNDPANFPAYRGITSELYGGGTELRLQQELLLGLGGWRLLQALGIKPEVCHLNEGHAAFAILERALSFMKETGHSFAVALETTRAGNLFTTHTAVPAGFDRFSPALMEQYLGPYATDKLGISLHELLALGRQNPDDAAEPFNMAYLAMRGSSAVNGVSRLHGQVSKKLFNSLFPRWPEQEIPVGYLTNGVHMRSWDSIPSDTLWTKSCGKHRWLEQIEDLERNINNVSSENIWKMRNDARSRLVEYSRTRLARQLAVRGASPEEVEFAKHVMDPNTLLLGFARRFATYKRPNMLLTDPERLLRILNNPHRPVQLILAGKAHPADKPGQALIQEWMRFINRPEARRSVIFLSDYDMQVTEHLVQGVDVWINTPRRPWEACGTSGMKVLVNGGLNLSVLDGWWAEAYSPEVGWALGDGKDHYNDPNIDAVEANALYELLENEIIPEFYHRAPSGIPLNWVSRIRASMSQLTPHFSANRAVRAYTERYYIPAAANYLDRAKNNAEKGKRIVEWLDSLESHWKNLQFREVKIRTENDLHQFEVSVYLNGLDPQSVKVELYAEGNDGAGPTIIEMATNGISSKEDVYVYTASTPATLPSTNYTPRIIPYYPDVPVPLEARHILWQH